MKEGRLRDATALFCYNRPYTPILLGLLSTPLLLGGGAGGGGDKHGGDIFKIGWDSS
mgnify:FL=1